VSDLILLCAGALADRSSGPATGGFEAAADAARLRLPDPLGALLRAARVVSDAQDDALVPDELPHERWLRGHFGAPADVSIEACAAAEYGLTAGAWRLTPVHIQVGHDRMRLLDPDQLALTPEHARALADAAAPGLAEAGFTLDAPAPNAWFMHGDRRPHWQARAWTLAVGRSIDAYLPAGPDARLWRRLFTEVQMAWHEHPVNGARAAAGLPAVNAVWLDGWSQPFTAAPPAGCMVSDDPALRGLARHAGWQALAPDPAATVAAPVPPQAAGQATIVDLAFWRRARRNGDAAHWHDGWRQFAAWLTPLAAGAWPAGVDTLRLVLSGERRCLTLTLPRRGRWLPWRRIDARRLLLDPGQAAA